MDAESDLVALSEVDRQRFGIRTARAAPVTAETLSGVMESCQRMEVELLIARCDARDLRAAQSMERQGFALMDTLVYYQRDLLRPPAVPDLSAPDPLGPAVRSLRSIELERVGAVASACFRGYVSHYHADERLDRTKCDETYRSWAEALCASTDHNSGVLVAETEQEIVGFAAMRLNGVDVGEVVLFGVAPARQRRGVGRSLVIGGMRWCLDRGVRYLIYSTQLQNVPAQKMLARLGFEVSHAHYTFHRWFGETRP